MKTILITGATDGIGKLLAQRLASEGYKLILHGRNPKKLDSTVSEMVQVSGNNNITSYLADLSELNVVERLADQIINDHSEIDVLMNNAGIFTSPISKTSQGVDIRFAVNYLAPFVLTEKLMPLLKKNPASRVINLSSAAQASVSLSALNGSENVGVQAAYAQSKLAITMWSFWLASQHSDLLVIAVNPGSLLNTKMAIEAYGQHWSSASKGSDILYDLTVSEEYENKSGQYFDNDMGQFNQAHADAYDTLKIQSLIVDTNQLISM